MSEAIVFGRYKLHKRLAAGQVADIYLATTSLADGREQKVVIKRFRDELSGDTDFAGSFIDEAKITAALEHQNIARVYEWSRQDGALFIAMEYIEGTNLASLMLQCSQKNLTLPLNLVLHVAQETLAALEYAHQLQDAYGHPLGIVHRAVNPNNIVISSSGQVKLVDFGMARASTRVQATLPGMFTAPQAYTAPEVMQKGGIDGRADLYSVGVLIGEMVSGSSAQGALPAEMSGLLARLRMAEPSARPATAGEVRQEIASCTVNHNLQADAQLMASFLNQVATGAADGAPQGGFAFGEATSHWFAEGDELVKQDPAAEAAPPAAAIPEPAAAIPEPAAVPGQEAAQESVRYEPPKAGGFAAGSTVMAVEEGGLSKTRHLKTAGIVGGALVAVGLLVYLVLNSLSKDPELKTKPAEIEQPANEGFSGPVQVKSDPEGALVFVDGDLIKPMGNPPRLLNLRSGTRKIKLLLPGYMPWEGDVVLSKDQPKTIEQKLEERKGSLTIQTKPSRALLFLDGKRVGRTPQTLTDLSVAKNHKLVLKLRRHAPLRFELNPSDWPEDPAQALVLEKTMERPKKKKKRKRRRR